ncbi:lysosomal acid glucosylceramidase [Neodiprion lecontei]|uniref:Glucosylceramidase n=1 Tax=Neodiprion lecontei TaxID=441921 RepID=A0A6J0CBH9_NEOLC|nr:lysosomal acid glucosylceramidase [Neodiprion lecontei]XP_046590534.1 lysosomal acid glucosylceramidase [Neodiprion lecontei]
MRRCILFLATWICAVGSHPCVHRDFGNNGTVCVCNATYCDSTPVPEVPDVGFYIRYTSSKDGLRFSKTDGVFSKEVPTHSDSFRLDPSITFQPIHGFGGGFSDSACINIKNLSSGAQENLMRTYFSKEGSNYNFGRIPIGATDFSTRAYTLDDHDGDVLLEKFSLAQEDILYKIPVMKRALEINPDLKLFAAAWTAPPWMRTNHNYTGYGFLLEEYYQVYANYLLKFMDKYKDHGLEMWALSTGNEPWIGTINISHYGAMGFTPKHMGKWVANNLGPTISKSKHNRTLILTYDDVRSHLDSFINIMFENELARSYIAAIAIHTYEDTLYPTVLVEKIHQDYPDKFIFMTEISTGDPQPDTGLVPLGSWDFADVYIMEMFQNFENWVAGWVDWNLAVNMYGGPNYLGNYKDAAIIVNAEVDEFYKQPLYYALTHFSKFTPPGSIRVGLAHGNTSVKAMAFETPKEEMILLIYNNCTTDQNVAINDPRRGNIHLHLPPKSIHTILYK